MSIHTELMEDYVPIPLVNVGLDFNTVEKESDIHVKSLRVTEALTKGYTTNNLHALADNEQVAERVDLRQKPELNKDVDGAIIRVHENSIRCELYTKPRHRFVNLPISYFPENCAKIGLPFNLRIAQVAGVRRPVIKIREVVQDNSGQDDFFDDILF